MTDERMTAYSDGPEIKLAQLPPELAALYREREEAVQAAGEAQARLHAANVALGKWFEAELRRWLCGCLRNKAGAHRVGCPAHPEGVNPNV